MATTIARKAGEGTAYWVLGGLYVVKVSSEESGGALTVMEMTLPPRMGPPPHTHAGGEIVYVLEGSITYHLGTEAIEGMPGSIFHIAEGTLEYFEPTGTPQTRLLVTYTPGGIDTFFQEVGELAPAHVLPPPTDSPPDLAAVVAAAERYGMRIQPPA